MIFRGLVALNSSGIYTQLKRGTIEKTCMVKITMVPPKQIESVCNTNALTTMLYGGSRLELAW